MLLISVRKLFEKVHTLSSPSPSPVLEFANTTQRDSTFGIGQCNVKAYNRYLRDMIISGVGKPTFVVSHEIGIDEVPGAYVKFDRREDGYTKV